MVNTCTMPPTVRLPGNPKLARNENRQSLRRSHKDNLSHNDWLATLSHELRSPIAAILDALELVFTGLDKPGAQRAGEIAQRQALKAMQIIEDLFDLSAHSFGKLALRKQWLNVADIVTRATE